MLSKFRTGTIRRAQSSSLKKPTKYVAPTTSSHSAFTGHALLAAVLLTSGVSLACGDTEPYPLSAQDNVPTVSTHGESTSAQRYATPLPAVQERTTTSSQIARANLDGQIDGLLQQLRRVPQLVDVAETLIELLLLRAQFHGTYSDFDTADQLLAQTHARYPERTSLQRLAFDYSMATHQFQLAETQLAELAANGQPELDRHASLDLALGRNLSRVLHYRQESAARVENFDTLSNLAAIEAALGHYAAADDHYVAAAQVDTSTTPYRIAWVHFQRGVMWAEMADKPEFAPVLYLAATARLSDYAVANTHLAELELELGDQENAIERLEALIQRSEDPEPRGLIAEALWDTRPNAAERHLDDARSRYNTLLSTHRAAFLDHGAEFFLGPGADWERARQLALENLSLRQGSRAYLVALRVLSEEPASHPQACLIASEASALTQNHAVLKTTIAELNCAEL